MPRWSIFTEERRKDTIKRAQMQIKLVNYSYPLQSPPPKGGVGGGLFFKRLQDYRITPLFTRPSSEITHFSHIYYFI